MEKCGCKGIRTCLLCEKQECMIQKCEDDGEVTSYTYCHYCNLCWPTDAQPDEGESSRPLLLSGVQVLPEFICEEEEAAVVSKIDSIPWVCSQSGRRKQDFGPKANFKKRKLKSGNFRGFPKFARRITENFGKVDVLSGFRPVELCHLEYCPERGSSIDPHLDDSWLWGERLVTLNFLSETTLTLSPAKLDSSEKCNCGNPRNYLNSFANSLSNRSQISNISLPDSKRMELKSLKVSNTLASHWTDTCCTNHANFYQTATATDLTCSITCEVHQNRSSAVREMENAVSYLPLSPKLEVRVILPSRSLLVLWGCARHHWYHEIKRHDVTSRRLAMTFRELSDEFLEGGDLWSVGKDLLDLAQRVID